MIPYMVIMIPYMLCYLAVCVGVATDCTHSCRDGQAELAQNTTHKNKLIIVQGFTVFM